MIQGNRKLYRNVRDGKIGGVCAGLADYFGFDAWLVRLAVVVIFFMGGGIMFPLYIAAWLILDPKPEELYDDFGFDSDYDDVTSRRKRRKQHVHVHVDIDGERQRSRHRNGKRASDIVNKLDERFAEMEQRLQQMEGFVTSSKYKLHRAFRDLDKNKK